MRLLSHRTAAGADWALQVAGGCVTRQQMGDDMPATLGHLLAAGERWPEVARLLTERAAAETPQPLDSLALLPCVPRPGKIVCLGVNYVDHAKEGGNAVADYPALFMRCATSLLAHGAPLRVPAVSSKLDYEAELAVVIGRSTRFASETDALQAVFGYACFNDATLRDYQRRTSQWTIGKNFDATGGFGPCLVTADELPAGGVGLHIESRLNGQVMQSANTSDMVFGVARTLSLLSECMTLEPGDVVVMGTPGGVGYARTPPVWMKAGDTIEIEIEGIGVLRNPVTP
jgi:2-keto-4-pentenoate hydratase/2-oxohepta-3-ene-1,7-dioic acid hydratase in catechol pathway